MEKIIKKESQGIISAFESDFKLQERKWITIESIWRLIGKYHPDLIYFYCWELWLPYEEFQVKTSKMKNTKFSQLTFEQKMKFIPLYNLLWKYNFNPSKISKIKPKDFISEYKSLAKVNEKIITDHLNQTMNDSKNLVWLVKLENILKEKDSGESILQMILL